MFCPGCGSEERQTNQFCRACGTDLRLVRANLGGADSVTASAMSAREEIGRAMAQKIREVEDAHELKQVAEDVLPQVEKFLESYKEKRLRRVRAGVIVAASGAGAGVLGLVLTLVMRSMERNGDMEAWIMLMGLGITAFAIGLGLVLNGILFTEPRGGDPDSSRSSWQNLLDSEYSQPQGPSQSLPRAQTTSNLGQPASITEHTTLHLKSDR
jgi:hypothetical protein